MWGVVFGLATVLTLAVILLPVARRSNIPYTVVLAVAGIVLGFGAQQFGIAPGDVSADPHAAHGGGSFWVQLAQSVGGLDITADVILFLFLPALVFESALSLDLRKLMQDIRPILFLAIVGVAISTGIVGASVWAASGMALIVCLLLGAIVSATDPVAVIALFKDLNAPKRLTVLVEGESLFNDATAIVISSIFIAILAQGANPGIIASAGQFLIVFLGGIAVGIVGARPVVWLMRAFRRDSIIILTLTVTLPFLVFVIAEHFLHVSGVMAVVAAGLTIGSLGRRMIPPKIFTEVEHTWHQLGFWATSLIFILVGLAVPGLLGENAVAYADDILLVIIAATLARGFIIFGLLPLLARFGAAQSVSLGYRTIMLWGGLRGAVSLALALIVLEAEAIPEDARVFIGVLVTGYVLFTLLFQATTIHGFMRLFGLDKLSPSDQAVRDRSVATALQQVSAELDRFAEFHKVDDEERNRAVKRLEDAMLRERADRSDSTLSEEDWVRTGLAMALAQERRLYLSRFGEGFVSAAQLQEVLARHDDVTDMLKATPLDWPAATKKGVAFRKRFEFALNIQRRFGLTGPLAGALAQRLGVLEFMKQVLRDQQDTTIAEIERLLPEQARAAFRQCATHRFETVTEQAEALALQFPDYAAALHRRDLMLAGLRLEENAYDRLLEQSIIGPEIHNDLVKRVESANANADRLPPLRLKLNPAELVGKVPFFEKLSTGRRKRIARLLKTRFFVPGDRIIIRGEIGEDMYFIASGAVRVLLSDAQIPLGTGDFFGELALITDQPRNADVEAVGFSTLLCLQRRDFAAFLRRHPDIREAIRKTARERLGVGADMTL